MSSNRYWEERIREEMKIKQKDDTQVGEGLKRLYRHHMNEIEKEIDHFIMKYGADGQVSPAQARKLVDDMDVVAFSEKAKRYVEEKNFSPEANAELKLYNLKMKVSRTEMLKQHLDLELLALSQGETQFAEKWLNRQFYKEMELQAGILGEALPSPKTIGHMAKVIVNTPYQNAVWSERIWKRQDILRREVSKTVGLTLMRGRNSTTMIPEIRKMFDVNSYQAKRLLVTETARMQTEVQKEMYTANDVDEYIFMAEPSACKICSALDGKTFQVSDMTPGKNASPMHPHCHCATAPDVSKERAGLETIEETELEKKDITDEKNGIIYKEADASILRDLQAKSDILFNEELDELEKKSVSDYTQDYFGVINRRLRNAQWEYDEETAKYFDVDGAINNLDKVLGNSHLGHNLKLFRYTDYNEFYDLQQSDSFKSYLSTSVHPTATNDFGTGYKIIINAPENTKGVYVGNYSDFSHEREFLMHRNTKYKILKVDSEKGVLEVELQND